MDGNKIYLLLLLGHVVGDFYLKPIKMVSKKAHGIVYSICILAVLLLGARFDNKVLLLWVTVSVSHFAINFLKVHIKQKPFITGQILHLLLLGVAWFALGRGLNVSALASYEIEYLSGVPALLILVGVLIIERPIGELISSNEIFDFSKMPKSSVDGAGKMIGYLERLLTFILLILGQFGVVGLIISAKSIMRFPEINRERHETEEKPEKAEYYLIGTLLSMTFVFVATFLLGLMPLHS